MVPRFVWIVCSVFWVWSLSLSATAQPGFLPESEPVSREQVEEWKAELETLFVTQDQLPEGWKLGPVDWGLLTRGEPFLEANQIIEYYRSDGSRAESLSFWYCTSPSAERTRTRYKNWVRWTSKSLPDTENDSVIA